MKTKLPYVFNIFLTRVLVGVIFIYYLIGSSIYSSAQPTFQKTFGDLSGANGESLLQLNDGGYIIAGTIVSPSSGDDVFLARLNANGDSIWTKTYTDLGLSTGYAVQQCTDSGFIVAYRAGVAPNGSGALLKVDQNGNFLWAKTYGGGGHEGFNDVIQTTDGGFMVTGFSISANGDPDVYLVKTDSAGASIWEKYIGGTEYDYGQSVQQTTDGGYIIAGYTRSFSNGLYDVYLIKLDSNDSLIWTKTIGDAGNDYGYSVSQTTDGGYIICGSTQCCIPNSTKAYLVKTDSNGDSLWTRAYGDIYFNQGHFVQQTTDDGYVFTGQTASSAGNPYDAYLIKTDLNGNIVWTKAFGGAFTDKGNCVKQTMDGGFAIVGTIVNTPGQSGIYIIKTDSLGNSGCNEFNTATSIYYPQTLFSNLLSASSTFYSSGTGNGFNNMSSGSMMSTLCFVGFSEIIDRNPFVLSPNPTTGKFRVAFGEIVNGKIEICNMIGENIFEEHIFNKTEMEIDLKNIVEGIFVVRLFNAKCVTSQKLVVRQD